MDNQRSINDYDLGDLFQLEAQAEMGGGVVEDPYPDWAKALARGSVLKGTIAEAIGLPPERCGGSLYRPGTTYYAVLGFNAVSDVFTRKDDFWSDSYNDMGTAQEFGDTILSMDGPRHRKFRDLLQPLFQPGLAETWWREKVIDPLIEDLVEGLDGKNSAEVNGGFFARLPLHTMTGGFGLSFSEGLVLREHMLEGLQATDHDVRMRARADTAAVFERAIREKRAQPCDDLISSLVHAEFEDEDGVTRKLTDEEITSYCRLIVFAGGETTWRQMGNALYALLNHPDQLADLMADRSLMGQTVLESVRWLG
jgi:cytochrome P450